MQCSLQIRWQAKNGVPKQTYFLTSARSVPGLLADPCMRVYFLTWMAHFQLVRRFHTYWNTFEGQLPRKLWPLENIKFIHTDKKRLEGTKYDTRSMCMHAASNQWKLAILKSQLIKSVTLTARGKWRCSRWASAPLAATLVNFMGLPIVSKLFWRYLL